MKAAVCHGFGEPLVVEEVELATPRADEVRVRVSACSICHSDVAFASGAWGGSLPAVYGHEAAGVVEEAGAAAGGLAPGDHVVVTLVRSCGSCHLCRRGQPALCEASFALDAQSPLRTADGAEITQGLRTAAFAEEVLVHHSQAVPVSPQMPLDRACLLACGVATGYGAVAHTAGLTAGESVAVIGAGGVGLNCIQGAVLTGAGPIIALDLAADRRASAVAFGATHVVDPAEEDARAVVRDAHRGARSRLRDRRGRRHGRRRSRPAARAPRRHRRRGRHAAHRRDGGVRARSAGARRHSHPRQQARLDPARRPTCRRSLRCTSMAGCCSTS